MNLLEEEKRVSEEEGLEEKVRRGRREEGEERWLALVLRRSGECVGGDKTDIVNVVVKWKVFFWFCKCEILVWLERERNENVEDVRREWKTKGTRP